MRLSKPADCAKAVAYRDVTRVETWPVCVYDYDMTVFLTQLWTRCRDVAAALIASLWPGRSTEEVLAWLDRAPDAQQRKVVAGTLAALFLLSLGAAQFGLIGMCLFWLAVIALIR